MHRVTLLGFVVDELRRRLRGPQANEPRWHTPAELYETFRASGLIRLLILDQDSGPLLPAVAADLDGPLEFRVYDDLAAARTMGRRVASGPIELPMVASSWGVILQPLRVSAGQPYNVHTLDEFVGLVVASTTEQVITLATAVRTAAHAFGGAHFIPSNSLRNPDQAQLSEYVADTLGQHALATAIAEIGWVVADTAQRLLAFDDNT